MRVCFRFTTSNFIQTACFPALTNNKRSMQQGVSENIRIISAFISHLTHTYNDYMPITLKIQFKDKLYKLAQHTKTLQQVQEEMKQRFPNITPLRFYYQAAEVTDLPALLANAARQDLSSIKLIAKKDSSDMSRLNQVSIVAESERNDSSVISLLAEDASKTQIVSRVALPNQFYVCYNCQGAKTIKQISMIEVCPVCKGAGRLQQGHNYVKRLRNLYLRYFKPAEQAEMMIENSKQETVAQRKGSFARVDRQYQVIVRETTRKETVEVGKVFSMKFQIKNIGPNWQNKHIEILEIGQDKGKTLSALKTGQAVQVELGPFVCSAEGALEKTYVLCYREGETLVRFGHKFGFMVRGVKAKGVRKIVSSQRERIRELKMLSGSCKSEEYLSLKLRSMGIDVMSFQVEDEVLVDVVRGFK